MQTVHYFLKEFAEKKNLNPEELTSAWHIWFKKTVSDPVFAEPKIATADSLTQDFNNLSFTELKKLCKDNCLPVARTKVGLLAALKKFQSNNNSLAQGEIKFVLDPILNKHVNYDTNLCLDEKTGLIIGCKHPNGLVSELLSPENVQYCKENNLRFDPSCVKIDNTAMIKDHQIEFDTESDLDDDDTTV